MKPHRLIYRGEQIYIKRWHLIPSNRWFNIYLHQQLVSDFETPHDHPWDNVSIILFGGYWETVYYARDPSTGRPAIYNRIWRGPRSIIPRRADSLHRLELPKGGTSWSLFITGRVKRNWGFQTIDKWLPHEEVLDEVEYGRGVSKIKPIYAKDWR